MLSLQRTLSLGYLAQHPTRMVLVVVSIALGVATLVATRSLDDSLHQAAKGAVNPFATLADLLVANGQTGVPADLADRLKDAQLPGLADAQPLVMGRAALVELDDQSVRLLGIQLFADESPTPNKALAGDNPWGLQFSPTDETAGVAWALLRGAKPVVVGAKLAERMKSLPNGTHDFQLRRAAGEVQKVTSLGTVRLQGQAKGLEDEAVFADVRTASSIIYPQKPKPYATQLNLKLAPGADKEQVRKEVEQFLKDQNEPGQVQTVEANEEMTSDVTAGLELGFSVGGYLALMVGLFLVYNALSVSVAERRHDIGVLRSVGATRRQIAGLFVGEAALLGLAGSLLGLPLGYGLAWLALGPMQQVLSEVFVKLPETTVSVSRPVMLLAVGAGVATALLASLIPALQAADEQPADAVRRAPQTTRPLYFALQGGAASSWRRSPSACGVGCGRTCRRALGAFVAPICLLGGGAGGHAAAGRRRRPAVAAVLPLLPRPGRPAWRATTSSAVPAAPAWSSPPSPPPAACSGHRRLHAQHGTRHQRLARRQHRRRPVRHGRQRHQQGRLLPADGRKRRRREAGRRTWKASRPSLPVRFHYFTYHDQFVYLMAVDVHAFEATASDRALARQPEPLPLAAQPDATACRRVGEFRRAASRRRRRSRHRPRRHDADHRPGNHRHRRRLHLQPRHPAGGSPMVRRGVRRRSGGRLRRVPAAGRGRPAGAGGVDANRAAGPRDRRCSWSGATSCATRSPIRWSGSIISPMPRKSSSAWWRCWAS